LWYWANVYSAACIGFTMIDPAKVTPAMTERRDSPTAMSHAPIEGAFR
jgi:hypothetical protein